MVRYRWGNRGVANRSPHPRGDGPWWGDCFFVQFEFSPPAWGWSDEPAALSETLEVLPTRVGMVL